MRKHLPFVSLACGVVLLGGPGPAFAQVPPEVPRCLVVPTVQRDPDAFWRAREERLMGGGPAWVIYLNRNGGRYDPGDDDSRVNRSSVLAMTVGRSVDFPPFSYGDAAWNALVACVREQYADFDVLVTDVDPGNEPHAETVVSGGPGQIGMPPGVGGISPWDCSPIANAVQFVFPDTYGGRGQELCEATAHETGHTFTLEHEYLCQDVMTYLQDCPEDKVFMDEFAPCGEWSPQRCSCGHVEQNSYRQLLDVLGPAVANEAPSVSIDSPRDGATVRPGFSIVVSASDDVGVASVQVFVDEEHVDTATEAPYEFDAPADLAEGDHTVEARAFDDHDAQATASITVTVSSASGDECDPLGRCPDGYSCVDGFCEPDIIGPDGDADADGSGSGLIGYRGGCSTAGAPDATGLASLGALVALALGRRRRVHS